MLVSMPGSATLVVRFSPRRTQKGQALVEFAFSVLLLLTLLYGIIEFSRALWTWNTIVQATRAGARFAVVETTDVNKIANFVVFHNPAGTGTPVVPGLTTANVDVRFQKNDGTDSTSAPYNADVVQVEIGKNVPYRFAFLVPLFGSGINLPSFVTTLPVEGLGVPVP